MLSIDKAIEHAREVARSAEEDAEEHEQLADWLEELKRLRVRVVDLERTLRGSEYYRSLGL